MAFEDMLSLSEDSSDGCDGMAGGQESVCVAQPEKEIIDVLGCFDEFLLKQGVPQQGVDAIKDVINQECKLIPELAAALSLQGYDGKTIFALIEDTLIRGYVDYKVKNGGPLSEYWVNRILDGNFRIRSLYYIFNKNYGKSGFDVDKIGLSVDFIKDVLHKMYNYYIDFLSKVDSIDNASFNSVRDVMKERSMYNGCIYNIKTMLNSLGDDQSCDVEVGMDVSSEEKGIRDRLGVLDRALKTSKNFDEQCSEDAISGIVNVMDDLWDAYHTFRSGNKGANKEHAKTNFISKYNEFCQFWDGFTVAEYMDQLFNNELREKYKEETGRKGFVKSVRELLSSLKDKIDNLGDNDESGEIYQLICKLSSNIRRLNDDHSKVERELSNIIDRLVGDIRDSVNDNKGFSKTLFFDLYEYESFLLSLTMNINNFGLDIEDRKKFLHGLFGIEDNEEALRAILDEIDDYDWLEDFDLLKIYLSLYQKEKFESSESNLDQFVVVNTDKFESMDDQELKDFINLIKTTQYWTKDVCIKCYDECVRRGKWDFLLTNYALGYFLHAASEEQLYNDLCSDERLSSREHGYKSYIWSYLPIFSYELVKSDIDDLISSGYDFDNQITWPKKCYRMLKNREVLKKGEKRGKVRG